MRRADGGRAADRAVRASQRFAADGGRLLSGQEAGEADRAAVGAGDSWDGLLRRAGGGLARTATAMVRAATGGVYGRSVVVLVGKGDNGGDGWVAASRLRDVGAHVEVVSSHPLDVELSDHSAAARDAWLSSGGRARAYDGAVGLPAGGGRGSPVLVVDCLLGTGASGAPRGGAAALVDQLRRGRLRDAAAVLACDVPSGVDADTGAVADPDLVVVADATATFGGVKRGLVLDPGARHAGSVVPVALGPHWRLPATERSERWVALGRRHARPSVFDEDEDKRARGRVAVVAGSQRYGGAPALAGHAALRMGAGLVTIATSADPVPVLTTDPGMMVRAVAAADDDVGGPAAGATDAVLAVVADADAAVLGPGLGHEADTRTVVDAVLDVARDTEPLVVVLDADGLNVFRHEAAALADCDHVLVLTPHERELARLLEEDVAPTAGERAAQARRLADTTGAVVVAKGPSTVVTCPDGPTAVVTSGGPALGTGGSGDVLAGMLAGALARSRPSTAADAFGPAAGVTQLHGLAGERAGAAVAQRATATDVVDAIGPTMDALVVDGTSAGW